MSQKGVPWQDESALLLDFFPVGSSEGLEMPKTKLLAAKDSQLNFIDQNSSCPSVANDCRL